MWLAQTQRLVPKLPDRAHGLDQIGVLFAELGAQASHVDIDRSGAAVVVVAPDPAQQGLPGEHLARVRGQELQQLVLHIGEVERLAVDGGLVRLEVHPERAVLDDLGPGDLATATEKVLEASLGSTGWNGLRQKSSKRSSRKSSRQMAATDQQQHRTDVDVAAADRPAQAKGLVGFIAGHDDRADPAVGGLLAAPCRDRPLPSTLSHPVESLGELGWGGERKTRSGSIEFTSCRGSARVRRA